MNVEIVLLLYNRPDHALAVVDSLVENGVARVRAFMDHPGDPETARIQDRFLDELERRSAIELDLYRQPRRLGLAQSMRFALQATFEKADAVIVLEDDCVVRRGGIQFFREGLAALQHDRRIRSLCGYLFPCSFIRGGEPLLLRRFCTWGWATWKDRWRDYDSDLDRVVSRLSRKDFKLTDLSQDLATLCSSPEYLEGRVDIWSLSWILEHYVTGTFCVYPCDSLIDNIGFDGSGRNCAPTGAFRTPGELAEPSWDFTRLFHCVENEEMLDGFMSLHGLKTYPSKGA
jgi:hypothetical protein